MISQNSGTFEAVVDRKVTPAQAADHLKAADYFRLSWRVRFASWVNRWWYHGV